MDEKENSGSCGGQIDDQTQIHSQIVTAPCRKGTGFSRQCSLESTECNLGGEGNQAVFLSK